MTDQPSGSILVVEDEAPLRHALADKLTRAGFAVHEATDGERGLAAALGERPDLILLDIVMPNVDGLTMLKNLRQDSWGKDVNVILLTNLSDMDKVSQAVDLKTYDYLVKTDWKIEDVVAKVKEKLGRK